MAFMLGKLLEDARARTVVFQSRSWWPEYYAAVQGGSAGISAFFESNPAGRYADYDEASRQLVGSALASAQHMESKPTLFGIRVDQNLKDTVGEIAGGAAKVGLVAGAVYAGGIATGIWGGAAAPVGEAALVSTAPVVTESASATVLASSGGSAGVISAGGTAAVSGTFIDRFIGMAGQALSGGLISRGLSMINPLAPSTRPQTNSLPRGLSGQIYPYGFPSSSEFGPALFGDEGYAAQSSSAGISPLIWIGGIVLIAAFAFILGRK